MAKQQTRQATDASNNLINQSKQQNKEFQDQTNKDLQGARSRRDTAFDQAYQGFQNQHETGGYDPGRLSGLRTQIDTISSTGGYDPTALSGLRQRLSQGGGGMDPEALASLRSRGNAFMDDGGFDKDSTAKIRDSYGNFISNGGFDDKARTDFLNRGTSGVTSTYNILKDRMAQDRAKSGGVGPGGAYSQLARQLSQQQAQSTLDSNVALNEMVNKNKLAGTSGLAGFEGDIAKNRLGAYNTATDFESKIAQGERENAKTLAGLESDVAGGIRSGTQMGANLEGNVANNKNAANEGMLKLFQTSSGEVSDMGKMILQSMGLDASTQEAAIKSLTELSKNPGLFQTALGNIVGLAGAAAGIGTGFGIGMPKLGGAFPGGRISPGGEG